MVAPLHERARRPAVHPSAPSLRVRRRRAFTASETVRALFVALAVATLLGSDALVQLARQQPYGTSRTVQLGAAHALDRIANAFSLNRPADALNRALGREAPPPVDVAAVLARQAAPVPPPATIPLDVNPVTGRRWVTAEEPLRVLLAGDSMMRELGSAIQERTPGDLVSSQLDYRVSTGLSRPDFFDWPGRLGQVIAQTDPEAVVLLFGTNDDQNLAVGGGVLEAGSGPWLEEYGRRVGLVMDLLHYEQVTVHWVAMPPMRSAGFNEAMSKLNQVFRAQAASRPWVHVVDLTPAVAGSDGRYAAYLPGSDGAPETVRQEDGVHFSRAGANRAGALVWSDIAARWGVEG